MLENQKKALRKQPPQAERDGSQPSVVAPSPAGFAGFLAAFPARPEGHNVEAARVAWERAIMRASPETILAGARAYAVERAGQPERFTLTARRWLDEQRWRSAPQKGETAPTVWIAYGSPEWWRLAAAWRATKGKGPPIDRRGGWWFSRVLLTDDMAGVDVTNATKPKAVTNTLACY